MYAYYVVCYRVIVAPYVRSVGLVFAYLYTLDDDSERPMDYETYLLPKVFSLIFLAENTLIIIFVKVVTMVLMYDDDFYSNTPVPKILKNPHVFVKK